MKRKGLWIATLASLVTLLSLACGGSSNEPAKAPLRVTLLISGSFGDKGFFDYGAAGIEKAQRELAIAAKTVSCDSDASSYLQSFLDVAKSSDLVFIMGFELYDLARTVSKDFPDTQFVFIDDDIPERPANLSCVDFVEKEGAYLAGVLAATTIKEQFNGKPPMAGFVGGKDIPVIRDFLIGYELGVNSVFPDAIVETRFADAFDRVDRGIEIAAELFDAGTQIIFLAAGGTGLGCIEEAKRRGALVIGVDSDQRHLAPDAVVGSMVKDVGAPIVDIVKAKLDGSFKPGGVVRYAVAQGALRIVYGEAPYKASDLARKAVADAEAAIRSGSLKIE